MYYVFLLLLGTYTNKYPSPPPLSKEPKPLLVHTVCTRRTTRTMINADTKKPSRNASYFVIIVESIFSIPIRTRDLFHIHLMLLQRKRNRFAPCRHYAFWFRSVHRIIKYNVLTSRFKRINRTNKNF